MGSQHQVHSRGTMGKAVYQAVSWAVLSDPRVRSFRVGFGVGARVHRTKFLADLSAYCHQCQTPGAVSILLRLPAPLLLPCRPYKQCHCGRAADHHWLHWGGDGQVQPVRAVRQDRVGCWVLAGAGLSSLAWQTLRPHAHIHTCHTTP